MLVGFVFITLGVLGGIFAWAFAENESVTVSITKAHAARQARQAGKSATQKAQSAALTTPQGAGSVGAGVLSGLASINVTHRQLSAMQAAVNNAQAQAQAVAQQRAAMASRQKAALQQAYYQGYQSVTNAGSAGSSPALPSWAQPPSISLAQWQRRTPSQQRQLISLGYTPPSAPSQPRNDNAALKRAMALSDSLEAFAKEIGATDAQLKNVPISALLAWMVACAARAEGDKPPEEAVEALALARKRLEK